MSEAVRFLECIANNIEAEAEDKKPVSRSFAMDRAKFIRSCASELRRLEAENAELKKRVGSGGPEYHELVGLLAWIAAKVMPFTMAIANQGEVSSSGYWIIDLISPSLFPPSDLEDIDAEIKKALAVIKEASDG